MQHRVWEITRIFTIKPALESPSTSTTCPQDTMLNCRLPHLKKASAKGSVFLDITGAIPKGFDAATMTANQNVRIILCGIWRGKFARQIRSRSFSHVAAHFPVSLGGALRHLKGRPCRVPKWRIFSVSLAGTVRHLGNSLVKLVCLFASFFVSSD